MKVVIEEDETFGKIFLLEGQGEDALIYAMNLAYTNCGKRVETKVPWSLAEKLLKKQGQQIRPRDNISISGMYDILIDGNCIPSNILLSNFNGSETITVVYIQICY